MTILPKFFLQSLSGSCISIIAPYIKTTHGYSIDDGAIYLAESHDLPEIPSYMFCEEVCSTSEPENNIIKEISNLHTVLI